MEVWGNLRAKLNFFEHHNILCRKFATFCSAYSFEPRRRWI